MKYFLCLLLIKVLRHTLFIFRLCKRRSTVFDKKHHSAFIGNCTVEAGGSWFGWFQSQEYMLINKDPAMKSPYKLEKCGSIPEGWRLITCDEAEENLEQIKAVLGPDKSAYVCHAEDGRVFGSGGDYKVEKGEHAYMLSFMLIKRVPEFQVSRYFHDSALITFIKRCKAKK